MQYVRDSFWRGREFDSLAQMQAAAQVWCREVAGARQSRALDGQQPGFVLAAVEQHALLPLPRIEFQLAVWSTGKVATDCHVKVGKALYSVPWRLMGAASSMMASAGIRPSLVRSGPSPDGLAVTVGCCACCW